MGGVHVWCGVVWCAEAYEQQSSSSVSCAFVRPQHPKEPCILHQQYCATLLLFRLGIAPSHICGIFRPGLTQVSVKASLSSLQPVIIWGRHIDHPSFTKVKVKAKSDLSQSLGSAVNARSLAVTPSPSPPLPDFGPCRCRPLLACRSLAWPVARLTHRSTIKHERRPEPVADTGWFAHCQS